MDRDLEQLTSRIERIEESLVSVATHDITTADDTDRPFFEALGPTQVVGVYISGSGTLDADPAHFWTLNVRHRGDVTQTVGNLSTAGRGIPGTARTPLWVPDVPLELQDGEGLLLAPAATGTPNDLVAPLLTVHVRRRTS